MNCNTSGGDKNCAIAHNDSSGKSIKVTLDIAYPISFGLCNNNNNNNNKSALQDVIVK
jgi:hypothetical protein